MKKIAVLNDLSGLGKCSLTAAVPVISVMGVQACPVPTAILSNQTGYASWFWDDYTDRLDAYMEEWKKRGAVFDGIYTGFLAGERQAEKILAFIQGFAGDDTRILTDPVLGDGGKAYGFYTEALCERLRQIAERAHVITPNLTEAMLLLYGKKEQEQVWEKLSGLPLPEYQAEIERLGERLSERFDLRAAVITGIDLPEGEPCGADREERTAGLPGRPGAAREKRIGNMVRESGRADWVISPKIGGSYSGTGDLFASVLSAGMVKGLTMKRCAEKAAAFLEKGIRDAVREGTDRNDGICFETYLHELWEAD